MLQRTIVDVPFEAHHALRSLLLDEYDERETDDVEIPMFRIRAADTAGQRSSASILLNRMYAWRGYTTSGLPAQSEPSRVTLVASAGVETLGTITVGFDTPGGLSVDEVFSKETTALRDRGDQICEFTKLAMDEVVRSKRVLASLFHVAYLYAHRINGIDTLLIEVNPRHVRYYQRLLGFEIVCAERMNPRVHAPAVLMSLDFGHAYRQIREFGGRPELSKMERSLYPYFFSEKEEGAILKRLESQPVAGPIERRTPDHWHFSPSRMPTAWAS